jgi:type I restriction enzyme S subunit
MSDAKRQGWKHIQLGDAASFVNGYAFKPSDWQTDGLEIIRIQNLTKGSSSINYFKGELADRYKVRKGDLLISWSATLGIYTWDGDDAWLNQHLFKVVFDKKDFDKSFFKHLISMSLEEMGRDTHGSTMKHITKPRFDSFKIPYPPLAKQQKIAAILDAADNLRQKDRQLVEKYTALSQSLFLEMFGDPVTNHRGFEVGTIRDLVSTANYGTSAKAQEDGDYPYLRMNNITYDGAMDFSSLKYISLEDKDKPKYLVKKGDILFNRTNSKELVGKTGLYNEDKEMVIAGYLIRLRTNARANPYFIWGHMNSKHGKSVLMHMCKSIIGMANINAQELQNIKIVLPPITLQNQFADRIQLIEQQKQQAQASLEKSEALFNSLLQRAFTGELTQHLAA